MVIRARQLHSIRLEAESRFVGSLADFLRTQHGQLALRLPGGPVAIGALSQEALERMVAAGVARARSHGLSWQSTIAAFVVVMVISGPNFDQQPGVRRFLAGVPAGRLDSYWDELWQRTSEEDWDEAARAYDPGAWYRAVSEHRARPRSDNGR